MNLLDPPPHLTTQVSWAAVVPYFLALPVSILLFKLFLTGGLPHVLAKSRMGGRVQIAALMVATLILGAGVLTTGYGLAGRLSYKEINDEGIREVYFGRREKRQVWKDLAGGALATKTESQRSKSGIGYTSLITDGVALEFKEGGRWRVIVYVWTDDFPEPGYKDFLAWVKRRLGTTEP